MLEQQANRPRIMLMESAPGQGKSWFLKGCQHGIADFLLRVGRRLGELKQVDRVVSQYLCGWIEVQSTTILMSVII